MTETVDISKELFITKHPDEIHVALLENNKLVEIQKEESSEKFSVGDIYYGKVKKIISGLNAAFVDIGGDKEAFLHYLDLGVTGASMIEYIQQVHDTNRKGITKLPLKADLPKKGHIGDVLKQGQQILVQIAKEAMSTKGPRLTSEISLTGRFLILIPFADSISISHKIRNNEEKKRLKKLVQSIKPKRFGIIIRTVAESCSLEDLEADLKQLYNRWMSVVNKLFKAKAPMLVSADLDKVETIIRDLLNDSFKAIYVDDLNIYNDIKDYFKTISFKDNKILHFHKDSNPLFEKYNIAKQIKSSFGKMIIIKNGVYLIIEHTEAMHVIDVNSGKKAARKVQNQEENALETNLIAAEEIARQIRLRDMGGIISIDFIDMDKISNRKLLLNKLMDSMKLDKSRHTILPMNKFGIIQITRHRVRKVTAIDTSEICPSCNGTGKIKSSVVIIDDIENTLDFICSQEMQEKFYLYVHPFIYSYLKTHTVTYGLKWLIKYKKRIQIRSNDDYNITEFKFLNSKNEDITPWKEILQ